VLAFWFFLMLSKRYTVVLADRTTGVVRRFTVSVKPVLITVVTVVTLPMLIGLGAALNYHDLSNYPTESFYSFALRPYYAVNSNLDVGLFVEKNLQDFVTDTLGGVLYGVDVAYSAPNGFAATGYVATGQDFGGSDTNFAGFTVGYGFANGFDFGTYAKINRYDGGGKVTRSGLTAGYLFAGDVLPVPVYLSGYIGTQYNLGTYDTLGVNLTIPVRTARLGKGQRPGATSHDALYEYFN
jgi:hypothetical protein